MNENIKRFIERAKIISFDIFDTLLLRPYVEPNDLFIHLEKVESAFGFSKKREVAEQIFLQNNPKAKEPTFDDIYAEMGDYISLKQKELELEYDVLYANPEMQEIYNYAISLHKIIIIVSDMYLPEDFIKKVLEKNGFKQYQKLYLSNAIGKRKDHGDMFDFILNDLQVKPENILHIGDNKHSDYKIPKRKKINAICYKKVVTQYLDNNKAAKEFYEKSGKSLGASIVIALNALKSLKSKDDYWKKFGYLYAGMSVYGYGHWIYEVAKNNNIKDLLFVARDGYLLDKIWHVFGSNIHNSYVYAPRIMSYVHRLDYDKSDKMQPIIVVKWFAKKYTAISSLLENVNLKNNVSCHNLIVNNIGLFRKFAALEKNEAEYANYINSKINEQGNRIGIVDTISSQLSAQRLIEDETGIKTLGFYFNVIGNREILKRQTYFSLFGKDEKISKNFQLGNKCDLVEFIFTSPEYPIEYVKGGFPIYKNDISESEKIRQQFYPSIESGAIEFVHDVKKIFSGRNIFITVNDLFYLFDCFIKNPQKNDISEFSIISKAPYADHNKYVPLFSSKTFNIRKIRHLVWKTPMQKFLISIVRPIKVKVRGLKKIHIVILPELKYNLLKLKVFSLVLSIGGYDE